MTLIDIFCVLDSRKTKQIYHVHDNCIMTQDSNQNIIVIVL